ncbi:MAG: FtsX-like permease family protein [Steroidobacteraceae bacterium]
MTWLHVLDRKLLRDLSRMKLQAAAVGAVLACGVALFVMATGMYGSLARARDDYYDSGRMADLAASVVRAPQGLEREVANLPGVRAIEARVSGVGLLDLPGRAEPVSARLVSLPPDRAPRVNDIVLRQGRLPSPARGGEVLVNEAFAEANGLAPGDSLGALIYGKRREVTIVGIASSPEFVFAVAPGALLPEPERFGVVWMGREALGRAFDLDGAFNDLVLRTDPGANLRAVAANVDRVLARDGGRGAYGRDRMLSAQFLADELSSLRTMASVLPPFFLAVAAFLLNVSLSRLVATERANIGLMKSFGYRNAVIAGHYAKFGLGFALIGYVLGIIGGYWVGGVVADIYAKVYRIPGLAFDAGPGVYLAAMLVALLAALIGSAQAVWRSTRLPPAAALAPPAPAHFGRLGLSAEAATANLDGKTRMVARRILRYPRRSLTTLGGIALAMALLVTSRHFPLSMNHIVNVTFGLAQRMDVMVTFSEASDERILADLGRLPGVLKVEPLRGAEMIFEAGSHRQRNTVIGVPADASLNRVLDENLRAVAPRNDGLTLSENLANKLGVKLGDHVHMQATDGHRVALDLAVTAIVRPYLSAPAYIELDALGRLLREPGRVTAAYLLLDRRQREAFAARTKELPRIVSVSFTDNASASMRKLLNEGSGFFAGMFVLFSSLMAAGVAFSAARVTFAEQERDLATMRVLGFSRREASYVLLAELGGLLLLALPVGAVMGAVLARWLMAQFETELFNFPFVTSAAAYAVSALIVSLAVAVATLVVRQGIDRLDLVAVLKARE